MRLSLQSLLESGVTWDNIAGVWRDDVGVCYSLKDKNALDQIECEILPRCVVEYLTPKKVVDE